MTASKNILSKLGEIQKELKAPKNKTNSFGKYKYRSCEDILEAVKPLLFEQGLTLLINDEIIFIEGRFYVKATATIYENDTEKSIYCSAYAREADTKAGSDPAQLTGACSSYARKYALNALFAIDDTKDADTDESAIEAKERAKAEAVAPAKTAKATLEATTTPAVVTAKAPAETTAKKTPNPIRAELVELCKSFPDKLNLTELAKEYKLNNDAPDENFKKALDYAKFCLRLDASGIETGYPEEV